MKTFTYQITDPVGIHARPAGSLVKVAGRFASRSVIACGDKQTEMTRLMALMGMGIRHGDTVTVTVEGADEDAAAAALKDCFQELL